MSVLSAYLNAQIPPGWRKTDLIKALQDKLDRTTVYKYLAGAHPLNPPEQVLQAFADVLPGARIVDLRAAVRAPIGTEVPWVPPPEANRLNARQRKALEVFIKTLLGGSGEESDDGDEGRDHLQPEQLADVLREVEKLRALGRDDLAEAVLERLLSE